MAKMAASRLTCWNLCQTCIVFVLTAVLALVCNVQNFFPACQALSHYSDKEKTFLPTVSIAVLVRNKAHILPWFLGAIERLDYPKERIGIWIRSDHNIDNSTSVLKEWLSAVKDQYHFVNVEINEEAEGYPNEQSSCDWTTERFDRVIKLRQQALDDARNAWADFVFMLDADVILENRHTLQFLIAQEKTIIGPMLNTSTEGIYSNFWYGMNAEGYYVRTADYVPTVRRDRLGCFAVPMVHSALLIDLRHRVTEQFFYSPPPSYLGTVDDIILFAKSVKFAGSIMHILNTEYFGTIQIPLDTHNRLEDEVDQFVHTKLEAMVEGPPLYRSPHVYVAEIPKDKLGFDEVYMINLLRRPERRVRMMATLKELGIDAKIVDAVDGQKLNDSFLNDLGVGMLPGFADPYQGRPLTFGEIGCFLSHYQIWKEMAEKKYDKIILFEDDVRFEPAFRRKLALLMEEVELNVPKWDLIYLGRKRLERDEERLVHGTESLVWPSYSYWTLSYLLSHRGAKKLLDQQPLAKMIPVDEYLPIMFDKHPEDQWKSHFSPRNLVGLSADPLLVYPTHYTGEPNYISDTEYSVVADKLKAEEDEQDQKEENKIKDEL